ncbi:hypothetical protein BGX26_005610, partial [Mortierella sp. AD094]
LNMTSLKACILLLIAMATAKAAAIPDAKPDANLDASKAQVLFRANNGNIWWVNAGSTCASFPGWLNDLSVEYYVDPPYNCVVYENSDCTGQASTITSTNNAWVKVPFIGISAIQCWVNN